MKHVSCYEIVTLSYCNTLHVIFKSRCGQRKIINNQCFTKKHTTLRGASQLFSCNTEKKETFNEPLFGLNSSVRYWRTGNRKDICPLGLFPFSAPEKGTNHIRPSSTATTSLSNHRRSYSKALI